MTEAPFRIVLVSSRDNGAQLVWGLSALAGVEVVAGFNGSYGEPGDRFDAALVGAGIPRFPAELLGQAWAADSPVLRAIDLIVQDDPTIDVTNEVQAIPERGVVMVSPGGFRQEDGLVSLLFVLAGDSRCLQPIWRSRGRVSHASCVATERSRLIGEAMPHVVAALRDQVFTMPVRDRASLAARVATIGRN